MPPKTEVLEYWAPWCEASRRMAPRMAELSAALGSAAVLSRVNADEADAERLPRVVPTFVLLRGGAEIARLEGERSKEEVLGMMHSFP